MKIILKKYLCAACAICVILTSFSTETLIAEETETDIIRYCVLVLDGSSSMSGNPATAQEEAAIKFCESILQADGTNYVGIVKLESSSSKQCDFTDDLDLLETTIYSISATSATNMNQALEVAGDMLEDVEDSSKNIVKNIILCSDGLPQSGSTSASGPYTSTDSSYYKYANYVYATATTLKETCTLYTLGFFHSLSGSTLTFAEQFMEDIASDSCYYEVTDVDELVFTFSEIAGDIVESEDSHPIIIIPGIMGSRFFTSSTEFSDDTRIWDPVVDGISTVDNLDKLKDNITSEYICVRPTINEQDYSDGGTSLEYGREYGAQDTYQELVDMLCEEYPNRDVYFFSYDWRKSNEVNAELLSEFVDSLGTSVDFVCHSMGGLVVSSYYVNHASDGYIDKIITLGTPYEGAPKVINSVMNWDVLGEGANILSGNTWTDIALALIGGLKSSTKAGFTGVVELTPTSNYISVMPMWQDSWVPFGLFDYELTYDEYIEFCNNIFGETNYSSAITFQGSLKANSGDYKGYNALLGYDNAYFAIGINQKTITAIKFQFSNDDVDKRLYESDLNYNTLGDGTVPYLSASIMEQVETLSTDKYETFETTHNGIVKDDLSLEWICDILNTGTSEVTGDTLESSSYIVIRIACPVDASVTIGNETLSSSADSLSIETSFGRLDILGEDDDIKMLCLDYSNDYDIVLNGTSAGTMEYTIRFYDASGELYDERIAEDVPITKNTIIHTGSNENSDIVLEIDEDGDGNDEKIVVLETEDTYPELFTV